ncbi:hypothetical protein EWB00_005814 [Schistosoma japonicum]|uniref:Uncharacterized protein n=1 Tax=Schistosoma japonicum TaxID=6182 RepID=A0A4Z2DTR6_SCHJA|nr:hypothetical protein EWB00_005814 [Schistosoma japonicum]
MLEIVDSCTVDDEFDDEVVDENVVDVYDVDGDNVVVSQDNVVVFMMSVVRMRMTQILMIFIICAVDENDFVVFEDDGNEVVIVCCDDVDDDEIFDENKIDAFYEVIVNSVVVICDEWYVVEYFGCVYVTGRSVVDVGVMVCVDCEYEEVDGDVIDENRVDVAEAV